MDSSALFTTQEKAWPTRRPWALITGVGPGGMGEAEAVAFLKRGVNVIATGLDTAGLDYIAPEKGSGHGFLVTLHMDVTSPQSIAATLEQVEQLTDGKLDFLLNNAGFGYYVPLLDADIEASKKQYDVNVWGLLRVTQAFFPMLREAKGTVVNQASVSGLEKFSRPYMGIYSSSKAAVLSLSGVMRVEFAPFDVNVVTLVTSAVKTEFFKHNTGTGIPSTSVHALIKKEVDAMTSSSLSSDKGHDRFQVAESTISELLQDDKPMFIRKGYRAVLMAWMYWLLPSWLLDHQNYYAGSLHRLKQNVD